MRNVAKLNIDESISKQRLILKEGWDDIIDRIVIYFVFSWFAVLPFLIFFDPYRKNQEDDIYYLTLLLFPFLFAIYVVYRKATEKRLLKIKTNYTRQQNRQILLDYAKKESFEIYRKSNECLIFNESTSDFNPRYQRSRIFIVEDNLVMFTIIQDRFKLNLPTLTSHLFLRHNLKKLFNRKITTETNAN